MTPTSQIPGRILRGCCQMENLIIVLKILTSMDPSLRWPCKTMVRCWGWEIFPLHILSKRKPWHAFYLMAVLTQVLILATVPTTQQGYIACTFKTTSTSTWVAH